jgi:hypothetical protein
MEKNNDRIDDGGGVQVHCVEAPDGVLDVIIRTIDDDELEALRESGRRAPARVH